MTPPPLRSTLFPYTTLFRSLHGGRVCSVRRGDLFVWRRDRQEQHPLGQFHIGVPLVWRGNLFVWRDPAHQQHGHGKFDSRLRSEEHTSELQSLTNLVCRLLL